MKVLLAIHHRLEPTRGAPGACLALGAALTAAGCQVEYFGFDQAFSNEPEDCLGHALRFPLMVSIFLSRHAKRFDVIDCTAGDAWPWAILGRPGSPPQSVLVSRSHGLEHVADRRLRNSGEPLSWKYPFYHGGFRLWQVEKSMRLSNHCIVLNAEDRDFIHERFRLPSDRVSVIPNGIGEDFPKAFVPLPSDDRAIRLAFVGSWIPRKGIGTLVETTRALADLGLEFRLSLLGTGTAEADVVAQFPTSVRSRLEVVTSYQNPELPSLLHDHDVLLFPSVSEGFSLALVEAMACGLVPIATGVGGAPSVVVPERNGFLVRVGDSAAIVGAILQLAGDRQRLMRMRELASETARHYRWGEIATQTIALYSRLLSRTAPAWALN